MSKKIFSAQDWENVPSEIQQAHTPSIAPIYNKVEEDVESVVREIEQCAIDIAPHYKDWVELGFALVDGLGENGREYYHRISRFYLHYQREETDKQYTHCLQYIRRVPIRRYQREGLTLQENPGWPARIRTPRAPALQAML